MKKVLLITFEYPLGKTYCGGVGQIVKQCREALLQLGFQVYVLISPEFLKKHPVKLLKPDGSKERFRNFWSFQKLYDWHDFNYIVQHFVNWTRELKKLKGHKDKRPKIIYHFHSILRREKDSGFKIFNHLLLNQERMIEIADRVICPSRYELDNFTRYFPHFAEKVVMVGNTIETFPVDRGLVQNIRRRYEIKEDDVVSIYVGRLERIKGADILTQNLPKVLRKNKRVKVFIVGKVSEGGLYRKLSAVQRRFPHQVFYIKYLEKRLLYQYYYLSHIYINTSLSESFSLSTHEGALCNNALLLNRLPVFDKFKDTALFFSNHDGNGDSFVSRYEELIRKKKLRNSLSCKARKVARDFISCNRLKDDYSSLLLNTNIHKTGSRLQ